MISDKQIYQVQLECSLKILEAISSNHQFVTIGTFLSAVPDQIAKTAASALLTFGPDNS